MDFIISMFKKFPDSLKEFAGYLKNQGFDTIADFIRNYSSELEKLSFPLSWENGHTIVLGAIALFTVFFALVAIRTLWLGLWLFYLSIRIRWSGSQGKMLTIGHFRSAGKCKWYNPICIIKYFILPYHHLWSEYRDTLHEYEAEDGVKEWRATAPSEVFFTTEALVDNRFLVWSDFVRHLPGIITGLGIIGTFSGLIVGLDGFSPSEDPNEVRTSLSSLLTGVQQAFLVSAIAITCAIGITIIEKFLLAFCYGRVEKINHAIDGLYKMGAGEQYLERLVKADEKQLVKTEQLKDALVNDLKVMLTELTNQQVSAYRETGQHISQSLDGVKAAVTGQAATETHVIKDAMEDLVAAFIAKMDGSVGGQMQGVKEAMNQSAQAIAGLESVLDRLASDLGNSTSNVVEKVVQQMDEAMQRAAQSQAQMATEMQVMVEQLRKQFETQQSDSNDAMKDMLEKLLSAMNQGQQGVEGSQERMMERLSTFMDQLTQQMNSQQAINEKAMEMLLAKVKDAQDTGNSAVEGGIGNLASRLEEALKNITSTQEGHSSELHAKLGEVLAAWDGSIEKLQVGLTNAVSGMSIGAEKIEGASTHFAKAGTQTSEALVGASQTFKQNIQSLEAAGSSVKESLEKGGVSVKSAFEELKPFSREVIEASNTFKGSADELRTTSTQLQSVGEQARQQVAALQILTANIKTEAGLSSEMVTNTHEAVKQLENAASSLSTAERNAAEYLDKINEVLENSFKLFGDEMFKQLEKTVTKTDGRLSEGVNLLTGLAQEQSNLVKRLSKGL